jgi:hypothetical protein
LLIEDATVFIDEAELGDDSKGGRDGGAMAVGAAKLLGIREGGGIDSGRDRGAGSARLFAVMLL